MQLPSDSFGEHQQAKRDSRYGPGVQACCDLSIPEAAGDTDYICSCGTRWSDPDGRGWVIVDEFTRQQEAEADRNAPDPFAGFSDGFRPEVTLIGQDGNALGILGACQRAARCSGVAKDEIDRFMSEATSGDYDHLLATALRFFEVG